MKSVLERLYAFERAFTAWATAVMGLLISSMYLGYALVNKYLVAEEIKYLLGKQGVNYKR